MRRGKIFRQGPLYVKIVIMTTKISKKKLSPIPMLCSVCIIVWF